METLEVVHPFIVPGEKEVLARLENSENPEVTTQLYDLGSFIVRERIEQTKGLDSKAGLLAGFVSVIIALLLSTFPDWKSTVTGMPYGWLLVFVGALSLWLAAFSTIAGIWPRNFEWLDEKDVWFAKDYLSEPEQLRRYHLIGMYRTAVSRDLINATKLRLLFLSHVFLLIGVTLFGVFLLYGIWNLETF